jgi:hypothetical protein
VPPLFICGTFGELGAAGRFDLEACRSAWRAIRDPVLHSSRATVRRKLKSDAGKTHDGKINTLRFERN